MDWFSRGHRVLLVAAAGLMLTGFGCRESTPLDTGSGDGNELVVWGLWQESADVEPVLKAFEDATGIKAVYRKQASVASYENDLLTALAEGRGPDVFVVNHTWVEKRQGIMSPAPAQVIDEKALNEEFVEVVAEDLVRDGEIYALPTSVDTLAMFYNRDILAEAGVAQPPETWNDFQRMVERITSVSRTGTIIQSGTALGTAENINRAADIMQVLLMQSGLTILNDRGEPAIANDIGERALSFYTDFANKAKKVYSWDLAQDYSIDAFAEGETATMINYSYHIPTIRAKNPRLNFSVAKLPQIAGSDEGRHANFAAYWPFAVSKSSAAPEAAWQLLRFMTNLESSQAINQAQGVPPARRDAITTAQRDPELGVFAEQALTAKTWARPDIAATDTVFNAMIDDVVTGAASASDALKRAESQLIQLQARDNSLNVTGL